MPRIVAVFAAAVFLLPVLRAEEKPAPAPAAAEKPPTAKVEEKPATAPAREESPTERWEKGIGEVKTPLGQVTIGGYATFLHATVGKINGGDSTNYFDAIRVVPKFDWQIVEWLQFAMEIEFEGGGAGASFLTDNEILLEYAEARGTFMDEFNVRAGLLLVPFGRYNKYHDDILWDLVQRPFVANKVIHAAFDQPGFGFYGSFSQIPFLGINYDFAVTQGFTDGFDADEGSDDVAFNSFREDNNDNKALWFRLGLTPDFSTSVVTADLGWSYTYQSIGPGNTQATRGTGVDGALKFRVHQRVGIEITGEWDRLWIHRPSAPDVPNGLWGYFVDVMFKFDPFPDSWKNHALGSNPYIGLIFRVEQNDLNDDFKGVTGNDDRFAFTAGISFRPISKLVLRIEWKNQQSRASDDGDENRFLVSFSIGM